MQGSTGEPVTVRLLLFLSLAMPVRLTLLARTQPRQIQIFQETFKVAQSDHDHMTSAGSQKGIDSMIEEPVEMVKVRHVL